MHLPCLEALLDIVGLIALREFLFAIMSGAVGLLVGARITALAQATKDGKPYRFTCTGCPGCGRIRSETRWSATLQVLTDSGPCPTCGTPVPPDAIVLEVLVSVLFAAVTVRFWPSIVIPAFDTFVWTIIALAYVDVRHMKLPSGPIYVCFAVAAVSFSGDALIRGSVHRLATAAAASVTAYGFFLLVEKLRPSDLGHGDVRFAGLIGFYVGWLGADNALAALEIAAASAGAIATLLVLTRLVKWHDRLPLGCFLAVGAAAALFIRTPPFRLG